MPLHCGAFCGQYRPFSTEMEVAMKIRRKGRRQPTKTLEAVAWPGAHSLERVRHLNEKCLHAVVTNAVADDESYKVKVVSRYRDLWRRMDDQACKRAAHIPVLLLDLSFESGEWWQWIVRDGPRPVRTPDTSGLLPIKDGAPLLREILVEACVIARSDPRAARLVFGMSAGVLAVIADLPASQIDSIALTNAGDLQLRWAHNLIFWKNLLSAALDGDETEMAAVRLHSLQLLGSNS
jgi:hypothetical protein